MVTRRISLFFQVIVVNAYKLWLVNEQRWLSNVSRFILIISFNKLRDQLIFQTFDASCKFNVFQLGIILLRFWSSSPRGYLQQASAIIGTENWRYWLNVFGIRIFAENGRSCEHQNGCTKYSEMEKRRNGYESESSCCSFQRNFFFDN